MRPNDGVVFFAGGLSILALAALMTRGPEAPPTDRLVHYGNATFVLPEDWTFGRMSSPLDGPDVGYANGESGTMRIRPTRVRLTDLLAAAEWEQTEVDGVRALSRERVERGVEYVREVIVDGSVELRFGYEGPERDEAEETFEEILRSMELAG